MITRLSVSRFKQFKDSSFDFRPEGVSLLIGGNNSGKSTVLHALAIWEFCRTAISMEKGPETLWSGSRRQGLGLGDDEFSPIAVPSLRHLWTNLRPHRQTDLGDTDGYTLRIRCDWRFDGRDCHLEFGLALANDRQFIKVTNSNLKGEDSIPRIAYLPTFAGITNRETRVTAAMRRRRIGEGLAGSVLRNVLLDLYEANAADRRKLREGRSKLRDSDLRQLRATDPWERLQQTLRETFSSELVVSPYNEGYHSYIRIEVLKGKVDGYLLSRYQGYANRDIMVEGSGFLQWLSVYALAVSKDVDVVLLDEPDAHLHAALQSCMIDALTSLTAKQVLLATHSSEVIRKAHPSSLLEVRGTNKARYLSLESQKQAALAGLGTDYSPFIDSLRQSRKLLFVEGQSDEDVLIELAAKLGDTTMRRWTVKRSPSGHKDRYQLFLGLREGFPDLTCLSLCDRDEQPAGRIGADLRDGSGGSMDRRTWRRREIENYLIHPPTIAALLGRDVQYVENVLRDKFGLVIPDPFTMTDAPSGLMNAEGKQVLACFGLNARDVARALPADAVCEDIATFLEVLAGGVDATLADS